MTNEQQTFANCPLSQPIFKPEEEIVQFNGFAWSRTSGMIHQSSNPVIGDPETWFTGS